MHRSRVKVTLSDDASVAIRRLSKASGESMSSVISSLFNPNVSELNDMANLLEHAGQIREGMPETSREFFKSVMSQMRNDMEPVKSDLKSPRNTVLRATPKERFLAETKRIEALKVPSIAVLDSVAQPTELEPWEIEMEIQERLEKGGNYCD